MTLTEQAGELPSSFLLQRALCQWLRWQALLVDEAVILVPCSPCLLNPCCMTSEPSIQPDEQQAPNM